MNSLYNQALKQSNALRKDLDAFHEQISSSTSSSAAAPSSPTTASSATALQGNPLTSHLLRKLTTGQIQVGLTSLSRTIDDYDSMAKHEIIAAKQEKAFQYQRTTPVVADG
jgi:golgi SNAP receptor complex member 2